MRRIVLASSNLGKLAELRALLAGRQVEVIAQSDLGIDDAHESGLSFVENALIKARHATQLSGLPALADDSGLCVDALDGQPGLYSARYAGDHGNDGANCRKLLAVLDGVEDTQRSAHFHCSVALLRSVSDPAPLIAEGRWQGRILHSARGTGGFGYDPLFLDPVTGLSAAELDATVKNRLSHRGQALAALMSLLPP
ncbi:MAG: RdgB/HAM1 family non-canonical purine NTP pyrophosphatase [Tahibacter sp.]